MDIKRLAERLVDKHGTRDPFRIAAELGYTIIYTPLVGVRGFYQYLKRCHIIYLDSELDDATARFVCAHELGHSFLHRGLNRIFMDTRTFIITGRYETEANQFAVDLIYSDEELQPYLSRSYERAAAYMGVSNALAEYRMREVVPVHPADEWA
ncbi:ImmA/IrrE family metallo-endopeptidase [Oscillospiraceae bacterium 50-58]